MSFRSVASGPVGGGCATLVLIAIVVAFLYVSGLGTRVLGQLQTAVGTPTSVAAVKPSGHSRRGCEAVIHSGSDWSGYSDSARLADDGASRSRQHG